MLKPEVVTKVPGKAGNAQKSALIGKCMPKLIDVRLK